MSSSHRRKVNACRTGEQEVAGASGVVHDLLDRYEDLGDELRFVDHGAERE
jgi:hypothetical protein